MTKLWLIYYNPRHNNFIEKQVHGLFHEVGDINQFGHILIEILIDYNGNFYSIKSLNSFNAPATKKQSLKNKMINQTIDLLNRLRKD